MRTLFDYRVENRVPDLVSRAYYWCNTPVLKKLEDDLLPSLTAEQQAILESYEAALCGQATLEKEALFLSTLALAKEFA